MRRVVVSEVAGVTSPLLNITSVSKGAASNMSITAIEVDGAILIDNQPSTFRSNPDTVLDSPMKNYAILVSSGGGATDNGGLTMNQASNAWVRRGTDIMTGDGKYYAEFIPKRMSQQVRWFAGLTDDISQTYEIGKLATDWGLDANGDKKNNNVSSAYGDSFEVGDVMSIAYDASAGTLEAYKNGVSQGVAFTGIPSGSYMFAMGLFDCDGYANLGQQPFVHTPPAGYEGLFQTWSQWVIQTLVTKSAEADALKVLLLDHAQTYQAAEDYCEGSVIKAFGELWIAVNQAPATTFADLPALMSHPNWERLNISVN